MSVHGAKPNRYFQSKIQKRVFFTFLAGMLLLGGVIVLLLLLQWNGENRRINNDYLQFCGTINSQMERILQDMNRTALQTVGNGDILSAFEGLQEHDNDGSNAFDARPLEVRRIRGVLMNIDGPDLSSGRISLYNSSGDYVSYGRYYEHQDAVVGTLAGGRYTWAVEQLTNARRMRLISQQSDPFQQEGEMVLSFFKLLQNPKTSKIYGLAEVQLKSDEIYSQLGLREDPDRLIYIYGPDGSLLFSPSGTGEEEAGLYRNLADGKDQFIRFENPRTGRSEMVSVSSGEEFHCRVVVVRPHVYTVAVRNYLLVLTVGIVLILLLATAVIFMLSRSLTRPLHDLLTSVERVSMNHLELVIPSDRDMDVVRQLNTAFFQMFRLLEAAMKSEREASAQALQSQMTPHFLYNVLGVISAAGMEDNSEKVPLLCERLSDMMRYHTFPFSSMVTMRQEVEHLKNYCQLMKARYEERFVYDVSAAGDLDSLNMPRVILQPLVENSFRHGFIDRRTRWEVKVLVTVERDAWFCSVRDNGVGMLPERLEEIKEFLREGSRQLKSDPEGAIPHLGLRNTILRLQLFGCGTISYTVENLKPQGLLVEIEGKLAR